MNCSEARERLLNGDDEEAWWHARHCAACAELSPERTLPPAMEVLDAPDAVALWQGMPEALASETHWRHRARNLSTPFRYTLAALGVLVPLLTVGFMSARADLAMLGPLPFWLPWTIAACVMTVAGWACLRPVQKRALSPRFHDSLCFIAVLLGGFGIVLPEFQHAHPASLHGVGADLLPRALGCFVWGSASAVIGMAGAFALLRGRRALASVPSSVWAVGILLAQLMLALHCPLVGHPHLALGHATIGVAAVAAVAIARGWTHVRQAGGH